jgi:hypothetical protein
METKESPKKLLLTVVWRYWGLTNIASAFVLYCALVRAGRYKFGL